MTRRTLNQIPAPSADLEPTGATPNLLTGDIRRQVVRTHASVLLFFLADGLLLTGYGWAGTVVESVGWLYAVGGCVGAGVLMALFWRRGGRVADVDRMILQQTLFAGSVMLGTLAWVPQVGGLMLMSMMCLLALGAVQLGARPLLLLCLLFAAASIAVLTLTGGAAGVPAAKPAERLLTGIWLVWLMLKASAHNLVARQLRGRVDLANIRLAKALGDLEQLAATDELTGMPNRRSIVVRLKEALEQTADPAARVGVAVLDIDDFKVVNDRYGHEVGDQVLRLFAELAAASLRPGDRVGRYGGEEFLLVLQSLPDARSAGEATERIRARVEGHDWEAVVPGLAVTVSAGVAIVWPDETSSAAIQRADAALYDAKRGGRNRVVLREAGSRLE